MRTTRSGPLRLDVIDGAVPGHEEGEAGTAIAPASDDAVPEGISLQPDAAVASALRHALRRPADTRDPRSVGDDHGIPSSPLGHGLRGRAPPLA